MNTLATVSWLGMGLGVALILACYAVFETIRGIVWRRKMKREADEFWAAQRAKWAIQDAYLDIMKRKAQR